MMRLDFIDSPQIRLLIIPFVTLSAFLVFHTTIESLLNVALVAPIMSVVEKAWYLDAIFYTVTLYFLISSFHKLQITKYHSFKPFGYWIVLLLIYFKYRINQDTWIFLPLESISMIKYLDIFPILGLLNITLMIRSYFYRPVPKAGSGFIEDIPIDKTNDDKLDYTHYASQLVTKLNESSFNGSFAVGITGEWGTGKTSFINLVKKSLDHSKFIVIDFNAWDSHSPKAIIRDFFATLTSGLSKYHSGISALLLSYSDNLIKSYDPLISSLLSPIANDLKSKSILEQRGNIEKAIPKIARSIIVCIDELDRLDKKELIEVIKLIRNTANFPKVIFLVSYDRNYLIDAIRKLNKQNSESFLEKIFQLEITLPYFETRVLQGLISDKLENAIGTAFKEQIDKVVFSQLFSTPPEYSEHISTIRDVSRLVNSFSFHFDLLKDEVNFHDLFYLEILRVKYPAVYELLGRKYDNFLQQSDGLDINQTFRLKTMSPNGYVISNYIMENHRRLSVRKDKLEKIERLLLLLFADKTVLLSEDNRQSIKYPSNFFMYFAYRLLPSNLSEVEFKQAINADQRRFNEYIEKTVKSELYVALIRRLKRIQFKNRNDFEKIINGIFHLQKQDVHSNAWVGSKVGYDGSDLAGKLSNSYHRLDKLYNGSEEEANKFIIQKFNEAVAPYPEASIVKDMLGTMVDDEYIVSKDQLMNILLGYLEKYLDSISLIDRNAWFLYQYCEVKVFRKESSRIYGSEVIVVSGANEAFISFIRNRDTYGFLNTLISRSPLDPEESNIKSFVIWDIATKIFKNWDGLYNFLNSINSTDKHYVTEFIAFYHKFRDAGFSAVPFPFKYFEEQKSEVN